MPRSAKKKHRLPRHSEEKRAIKYRNVYGLDLSLPIGDRDDEEDNSIIAEFDKQFNQTKEIEHE